MAKVTLGMDVGSSSLGWALIAEEEEKILAAGVRVFPEGVDRDQQGGEKSKSQSRREARGMRRQIQRRARRRRLIRKALIQAGLLPNNSTELENLLHAKKGEKKPSPYELRAKALKNKLEIHELGRVLLHLAKRRGYSSNRKTDKAKESKGILAEMDELGEKIKNAGCTTLGGYFAKEDEKYNRSRAGIEKHIRGLHTKREMYIDEFEAIWSAQQEYYPQILTDVLKYGRKGKGSFPKEPKPLKKSSDPLTEYGIYGILFFQRKMYWPKSVVGRCELEPHEKRCPRAARIAQRFRMFQEINNLMLLDRVTREYRSLSQIERETLLGLLSEKEKMTFDDIRKKLKLGDTVRFNFESGGRDKLDGHKTDHMMAQKRVLGKRWKELSEDIKDKVVDILIKEDQDTDAIRRLTDECNLTEEEAQRAISANLPESYMSFSRAAMRKLLPFMVKGFMLMGQNIHNSALHAAGYLRPINQRRFLPLPPQLTNPLVRQAMYEVRKTINAILKELVYRQEHDLTHIYVELAREAKKSFDERKEIRFDNIERQKIRANAAKTIEEFDSSIKPTGKTINRYLLWKEQGEDCPYCGKKISLSQLFNGDADVDHILPRWRSLDDSMANKVIAHRTCNEEKGDQTPCQWLESDPERYQIALKIASIKLPFGKQKKFQQKEVDLTDFVNRQLTDTAYITRCVSQYLRCLGVEVVCTRGQMTSDLRYYWGLNPILNPEGQGEKNRDDHRHHAVDALVIGLTDSKRLFALANDRGKNIQPPWPGFREAAETIIKNINVSHRSRRRISGKLHESTFYGMTQKEDKEISKDLRPWAKEWIEDKKLVVHRIELSQIKNTKELKNIRDKAIQSLLREHLEAQGIDTNKPRIIPKQVFSGNNLPRMKSGVPIRRVRVIESGKTMRPASVRRAYQYVNPKSNHHIVYRLVTKKGKPVWIAEVIPMCDAALRALQGLSLIDRLDREGEKFLMSLSIGEIFQINGDKEPILCVVKKIRRTDNRLYYKLHTDARSSKEIDKENLYLSPKKMQERKACKVIIDRLGRIRSAND
ncbi:MAG: type II CRISPR RNA-guided endonuclease Cas9 [Thermoguttaceae bacterium]